MIVGSSQSAVDTMAIIAQDTGNSIQGTGLTINLLCQLPTADCRLDCGTGRRRNEGTGRRRGEDEKMGRGEDQSIACLPRRTK